MSAIMPRPGKKPPTKRVDELNSAITLELLDEHKNVISIHERESKMIDELIKALAYCKAQLEMYELSK